MTTRSEWMLYGAYGSTGRLILDEALRRGHRPVLAGRDSARLSALGQATGLRTAGLPLDDSAGLRAAVSRGAGGTSHARRDVAAPVARHEKRRTQPWRDIEHGRRDVVRRARHLPRC